MCLGVCIYIYIYTYIHTHTNIYIYNIYIYMYTYVYIYIYVYTYLYLSLSLYIYIYIWVPAKVGHAVRKRRIPPNLCMHTLPSHSGPLAQGRSDRQWTGGKCALSLSLSLSLSLFYCYPSSCLSLASVMIPVSVKKKLLFVPAFALQSSKRDSVPPPGLVL